MKAKTLQLTAQEKDRNVRIDKALAGYLPEQSRQYLQKLLKEGHILVNGQKKKPNYPLQEGDLIEITIPAPQPLDLKATAIPLSVVYEDKDLIVINKPAGMVTHPGVGTTHLDDSLVSALLYHYQNALSGINGVLRPGIVHRLDKDTSGLLIVAKNDQAHRFIVEQMKHHAIRKIYQTLVIGKLEKERGTIEAPIGRNPRNRKIMTIIDEPNGRNAITRYEVLKTFMVDPKTELKVSLVKVQLVTGRTHQIRVHFASIGHPVVGDTIYGRPKINTFFAEHYDLHRQFLHARHLSFELPSTHHKISLEAPLPPELEQVRKELEVDCKIA